MPGHSLDDIFDTMPLEEKRSILAQMAKIIHALQSFPIPESITEYGGVTFDDTGRL
jgi:hypothetical protein